MGAAKKLIAADLFCGGGGFSKGFALACEDLKIKNFGESNPRELTPWRMRS